MSTDINPAQDMVNAVDATEFAPGYADIHRRLESQFQSALHSVHGDGLNEAQHRRVYEVAYEEGHASGWFEIQNRYIELAGFARDIIAS